MTLNRRTVLAYGAAAAMGGYGLNADARPSEDALFIWDNHGGFGYAGPDDLKVLDYWRRAGIGYLSINVGYDAVPWSTTVKAIANYTHWIESRSDMVLCATLAEVQNARRAGKMALTYDIEGMGALSGDLAMVEFYHRQGVRQMLIAYNINNDAGGGCHDDDKGLTDFGRAVIAEMNRVGMVVDCAHSGIRSGLEAMRLSTKPCIFSHANARAVWDHERNITDEQIKAVAATGGVVGVNGLSGYLGKGRATIESFVTHIDYMAKLVGPEHVGIGLDYDPTTGPVLDKAIVRKYWPPRQYPGGLYADFLPPSALPEVTVRLRALGYRETAVRAIMGGNFMRIASQVWAS